MNRTRLAAALLVIHLCCPAFAAASGHGPVFGLATPTLGRGGWQLDQAWLVRVGDRPGTEEQTLRTMISFGITEDLQVSCSLPINLITPIYMPRGRFAASMSPARELETSVAWRIHKRTAGSSRFESTVAGGIAVPLEQRRGDGMYATPSIHMSIVSGYASRAHYLWVGGGYQHHADRQGDRMGHVAYYTAVYGFRPPALRLDYPRPDLRFFVEAVGEHTARAHHHGFEMPASGGTALLVGPSALLLYKAIGISGGVLFPAYQRTNFTPLERFRASINVTYFFWLD